MRSKIRNQFRELRILLELFIIQDHRIKIEHAVRSELDGASRFCRQTNLSLTIIDTKRKWEAYLERNTPGLYARYQCKDLETALGGPMLPVPREAIDKLLVLEDEIARHKRLVEIMLKWECEQQLLHPTGYKEIRQLLGMIDKYLLSKFRLGLLGIDLHQTSPDKSKKEPTTMRGGRVTKGRKMNRFNQVAQAQ